MTPSTPQARRAGFTFLELLLALSVGVLVTAILGALIHGLLSAKTGQARRMAGPVGARAAVRTLAREISGAFAPPVKDLAPLTLETSTEIGRPEVALSFYTPVPTEPRSWCGYDIEHVTYEVAVTALDHRELRRISTPCSGPLTNAPVTNRLFEGQFALGIEILTNGTTSTFWPPPDSTESNLPPALRLTLALPGEEPVQTDVLIQAATGLRSPLERSNAPPAAAAPAE